MKHLEPEIEQLLVNASKVLDLPSGTRIFGPGQSPEGYLLLLDGVVRVQQVSESGREIVLHRIGARGNRAAIARIPTPRLAYHFAWKY